MNFHPSKHELRQKIRQRRLDLDDRVDRSQRIQQSALSLPELQKTESLLVYVGYRSEVATLDFINQLLLAGKTVFVPWCKENELRIFRLQDLEELQPGAFGIPEPPADLRLQTSRVGRVDDLGAVIVPGVAFDHRGNRLGQGKGYYDRLLANVSDNCLLIGFAFAAQLVEQIPTESHDIRLDLIVTEETLIRCS